MIKITAKRYILECSKDWLTTQFNALIKIISVFPYAIHLTVTKCKEEESPSVSLTTTPPQ